MSLYFKGDFSTSLDKNPVEKHKSCIPFSDKNALISKIL